MEVLYMDKNEFTKTELWTKRIKDFYQSGFRIQLIIHL